MKWRAVVAVIVMTIFLPGFARSESRALQFMKKIGVGWSPDKFEWMDFVAFSPDGTIGQRL
jgi:hypothetical protein